MIGLGQGMRKTEKKEGGKVRSWEGQKKEGVRSSGSWKFEA